MKIIQEIILPFLLILSWNGNTALTNADGFFSSSKLEKTTTPHHSKLRPARKLTVYEAGDTPALKVSKSSKHASASSGTGGTEPDTDHSTASTYESEGTTGSDSSSSTYESESTTESDTSSTSESSTESDTSPSSTSESESTESDTASSTSESISTGSDTSPSST
eukprot:CAMPEP_0198294624 /NCGR_PEP_ID=MMETSP1449-20131203/23378_1 /TAXON_ID=420275 /ORGANISM="Attheya septentrionalis, Strain CCMP2084" /LENGTH=164 /DNA_ID=CAMNT_0043994629 /DNA_START=152 /DNA_END=642 /DNA_ORIENTATION=+